MPDRRTLVFETLEDVMAEVDRLLKGHVTLGRWSLGQICNHLAGTMRASVEGVPFKSPWLVRTLIGPVAKRQVFRTGRMPQGVRLPEKYRPHAQLDARAEAEALRATILVFSTATGLLGIHPFFGRLNAEEWRRFHVIHAAHHLGFVVPDPPLRV